MGAPVSQGLRDILFGAFALMCGAILWWETTKPKYQVDKVQDYGFDPAFYPRILIVIWVVLAIAIAVRGLKRMTVRMEPQRWFMFLGSAALTAAYMIAMDLIGFLFSSIAFALLIMPFLGFRKPLVIGLVAVLFPLATWYCFVFLLKIPLPTSPFFTRL